MSQIRIPVLLMPHFLRDVLSIPQGSLVVAKKNKYVRGVKVDIAIGDVVAKTLVSRARIIDYKTRRKIRVHQENKNIRRVLYIANPAGTLSLNTLTIVPNTVFDEIIVDGEEDLVPLAAIRNNNYNSIAYGQPGVGVVVIEKNMYTVFRAREILKTFKPVMYAYTSREKRVEY